MSLRTDLARRPPALLAVALLLGTAFPASAETLFVTDITDGLPAPPGSLRAAIEKSETNGEPDRIVFLIDGGTIELVAPLPDLTEGQLRIGGPRPASTPPPTNGIAVSGANGVPRALRVASAGNLIAELDFIRFVAAGEILLVEGSGANDNVVSGCAFGRDNAADLNAGAAVRVRAGSGSLTLPTGTVITASRFVGNAAGLVIEGSGSGIGSDSVTIIRDNWFGTDPQGGPGPGNGEAIHASDGGRVLVLDNRFSGPGQGISLVSGADASRIEGNAIGVRSADLTGCSGFDAEALRVQGSSAVVIQDNRILCSDEGIYLGPNASAVEVRDNQIGGGAPAGHLAHGIVLDSTTGTLVRRNLIAGNGGFGITASGSPGLIACNSIANNAAGALDLPNVAAVPPELTLATPVRVDGNVIDPVPGWIEVFGDDLDQARVFQGALSLNNHTPPFSHRLPVLGLTVGKQPGGAELRFDREIPTNHTAGFSGELSGESTTLSDPLAAAPEVLFDVIRGRLGNLASGAAGQIDLGPVVCLDSGLDPDPSISPNVVDPDVPPPGSGFFYVVRRRGELLNTRGTYDPAICLTDVDDFAGGRVPSSGDCD